MASNIRINLPIPQEPKERLKDYKLCLRSETAALGNVPALLSTLGSDCFAFSRWESLALATLGPRGPPRVPRTASTSPAPVYERHAAPRASRLRVPSSGSEAGRPQDGCSSVRRVWGHASQSSPSHHPCPSGPRDPWASSQRAAPHSAGTIQPAQRQLASKALLPFYWAQCPSITGANGRACVPCAPLATARPQRLPGRGGWLLGCAGAGWEAGLGSWWVLWDPGVLLSFMAFVPGSLDALSD